MVIHAAVIMCVLVRLLTCQLLLPVIVMESAFMQKTDLLSLWVPAFSMSYQNVLSKPEPRIQATGFSRIYSIKLELHLFILHYTQMSHKDPVIKNMANEPVDKLAFYDTPVYLYLHLSEKTSRTIEKKMSFNSIHLYLYSTRS